MKKILLQRLDLFASIYAVIAFIYAFFVLFSSAEPETGNAKPIQEAQYTAIGYVDWHQDITFPSAAP